MITITITVNEKETNQITFLNDKPPIQYKEFSIKRKYYRKWDPEYHRKPIKKVSKSSELNKIVRQVPLLDFHC